MQPKETFTIKELSELFEISRQAISKHIDKLDSSLLAKNDRGYKVVLRSGVLQLARNLDNKKLLDKLRETEFYENKNIDIKGENKGASELLDRLHEENIFLREQLILKEQNTSHLQKLLDQQQQLTLQANKQIESLQEQLQLTFEESTTDFEKNDSADPTEDVDRSQKWWRFWE